MDFKYRVNTNLHLNHYGAQYHYYRYYLSISSNRDDGYGDRHKYWFGVVKFSHKIDIDDTNYNTNSLKILTNDDGYCIINPTTSSAGVFWLNITLNTAERSDQVIVILH
jgi:hypothetical protein